VTTSGAVKTCGDVTFSVAGSLYQRNIRRWHVKNGRCCKLNTTYARHPDSTMASKWKTLPLTLLQSSNRPFSKTFLYQISVYISILLSSKYIIMAALNYYVSRIKQGIAQNTIPWTSCWTMSYKESINMQNTQHAQLIKHLRDRPWRQHRLGLVYKNW